VQVFIVGLIQNIQQKTDINLAGTALKLHTQANINFQNM